MTYCIHTNILDEYCFLSEVYLLIENGIVCNISTEPITGSIDYTDSLMGPCLFNIHCHLGESLYALDPSQQWNIKKYIEYTESINSNLTDADKAIFWEQSARLTASKQLENGVSGICAARSADICKQFRLNCMTGYPIMNSDKLRCYKNKGIEGFLRFLTDGKTNNCSVGVFFHSLYSNDDESLRLASSCMERGAEFLTIHISEDQETRILEMKAFGQEPIKVLNNYGLLNERTIIVHGGFLSSNELDLISKRNATIAICPISNKVLNTRMPDLRRIRDLGINWCIASDGLATGKSFSLLDQIEELKKYYPDISSYELYDSCTRNCAKLFHRDIYTGRIAVGSEARFIRYPNIDKQNSNLIDQILSVNNNTEINEF